MVQVQIPPTLVVRQQPARFGWRNGATWTLLWLLSLLAVAGVVWIVRAGAPATTDEPLQHALAENATLQHRVAVLERADQVAHAASADLQREISERQGEIASLRADLAFYSGLTGTAAKREGLAVHELHIERSTADARMLNFTITLTQNLKPGAITTGRVQLSVSGLRANKLVTLDFSELAPNQDTNGLPFSFKYFQQIKGNLLLPDGFDPQSVHVDADAGAEFAKTARDFSWAEVTATPGVSNAG